MIYGRIYDRVCFEVWGNTPVPPGVDTVLKGADGIISILQQQIQEDYNFWFMEKETSISVIDGTTQYDLDSGNFKEEISFRFENTNGDFLVPLERVREQKRLDLFRSASSTTEYPPWYYKDWNASTSYQRITLYPEPSVNHTLWLKYWGYLTKLTDATFDDAEDTLSIESPMTLVYGAVEKICKSLEYYDKMALAKQDFQENLEILKNKSWSYRKANLGVAPNEN